MVQVNKKRTPKPKKVLHGRVYPWLEMEADDDFTFPPWLSKAAVYQAVRYANTVYAPRKFEAVKTDKGYQCWRIA